MKESLYYLFLSGLVLGSGPCLVFCGPVLAGYVAAYKASFGRAAYSYAVFSAGRLVSYVILGALCGAFSGVLKNAFFAGALGGVSIILALFILIIGIVTIFSKHPIAEKYCMFLHKGNMGNVGVIGLLAGFSPCLPLIGILNYIIIISHSIIQAMLFSFVFGLGTAISPAILLIAFSGKLAGFLSQNKRMEKIVRICSGLILIFLGLMVVAQKILSML